MNTTHFQLLFLLLLLVDVSFANVVSIPADVLAKFDVDADGALARGEFFALFLHFFDLEADEGENATIATNNATVCPLPTELFTNADSDNDTLLTTNTGETTTVLADLAGLLVVGCADGYSHQSEVVDTPVIAMQWVAALGSSIIVSLPSLLGVLMIPLNKPWFNRWVTVPLLAFAVGSLVGDSFLHLLPSVYGLHDHSEHESKHEHANEDEIAELVAAGSFVWKSMLVIAGVLLFFVTEKVVRSLIKSGFHVHGHAHEAHERCPHHGTGAACAIDHQHQEAIEIIELNPSPDTGAVEVQQDDNNQKKHGDEVKPMGVLALVVDLVHNLIDGIAIGAAFSASMSSGWATMLAVFFHEVPQELGDVALLARAGFSRKKLVLLNVLVSTSCIVGATIGVGVGSSSENALWAVLALTAGGFLYLALADLVPDFIHEGKATDAVLHFGAMCLGVLAMFGVLFLE